MDTFIGFVIYVYLACVVLGMVRLLMGPTIVDRMIALNLVTAQVVAILVLIAVRRMHVVFLDVALVYDIFGFIGIMAITKYFADKERA